MNIEEILNDKELFWRYILGNKCKYCKAKNDKFQGDQTIEEAQKETEMTEKERKIAALKARVMKHKESEFKCASDHCFNKDYADFEKVNAKYDEIISGLKENIDFWSKSNYNLTGECDNLNYYIKFQKGDISFTYNNTNETFNKHTIVGSKELIMLGKFLEIINS